VDPEGRDRVRSGPPNEQVGRRGRQELAGVIYVRVDADKIVRRKWRLLKVTMSSTGGDAAEPPRSSRSTRVACSARAAGPLGRCDCRGHHGGSGRAAVRPRCGVASLRAVSRRGARRGEGIWGRGTCAVCFRPVSAGASSPSWLPRRYEAEVSAPVSRHLSTHTPSVNSQFTLP
jgi:hypothetical protein